MTKVFVICRNDFPAQVLAGTADQAENKLIELAMQDYQDTPSHLTFMTYRSRVHWHIQSVKFTDMHQGLTP